MKNRLEKRDFKYWIDLITFFFLTQYKDKLLILHLIPSLQEETYWIYPYYLIFKGPFGSFQRNVYIVSTHWVRKSKLDYHEQTFVTNSGLVSEVFPIETKPHRGKWESYQVFISIVDGHRCHTTWCDYYGWVQFKRETGTLPPSYP